MRFLSELAYQEAKYQDLICENHRKIKIVNWNEQPQQVEEGEHEGLCRSLVMVGRPGPWVEGFNIQT
jgi:hypothetical protein